MQKLEIPSNKYKLEWCSIIEKECEEYTCALCSHAIEFEQQEQEGDYKSVYTFEAKKRNGIIGAVNGWNTVLKCDSVEDILQYMDNIFKIEDFAKITGLLDRKIINKEYPHYNIILKKLKLGPCVETYYMQAFALISVHGDVVIATAPRIED